jgi:hypothetical protein
MAQGWPIRPRNASAPCHDRRVRACVALLAVCAACGAGPYERSSQVALAADRVSCRPEDGRAVERDGRYDIDVCGYHFARECHATFTLFPGTGDRACSDLPLATEVEPHTALTARRLVAADGRCPMDSLAVAWEVPPGTGAPALARVSGCGSSARVSCPSDALQPSACQRLSFDEESHRDALAVSLADYAARRACPPASAHERASSWHILEPKGEAPVWSLFVEGCGETLGYLCRRHDPAHGEAASCASVPLDAPALERAAQRARDAFARTASCSAGAVQVIKHDVDNGPRRRVWVEASGCGARTTYLCTFHDLIAAEAGCAPLDAAYHEPFVHALEEMRAVDAVDRHCERHLERVTRGERDYHFDVRWCQHVYPYLCTHDALADQVSCRPDDAARARRAALARELAVSFALATACPEREVQVAAAHPHVTAKGLVFEVSGCGVRRTLTCADEGRAESCQP